MIKFLKNIIQPIKLRQEKISNHFKNLDCGEKLYIDGKPYVKVKLRFVDSLNFQTSKYIDQLEYLNESLNTELETLKNREANHEKMINDLQNLNINLVNEIRITNEKLKTVKAKLNLTNVNKDKTIANLKNEIYTSNIILDNLNGQIQTMKTKLDKIGIRNDFLENEINYYRTSTAKNSFSKRDINKLKRNPNQNLYSMFLKNEEIDAKDKIISVLKARQGEYLKIIDELKHKLEFSNTSQ